MAGLPDGTRETIEVTVKSATGPEMGNAEVRLGESRILREAFAGAAESAACASTGATSQCGACRSGRLGSFRRARIGRRRIQHRRTVSRIPVTAAGVPIRIDAARDAVSPCRQSAKPAKQHLHRTQLVRDSGPRRWLAESAGARRRCDAGPRSSGAVLAMPLRCAIAVAMVRSRTCLLRCPSVALRIPAPTRESVPDATDMLAAVPSRPGRVPEERSPARRVQHSPRDRDRDRPCATCFIRLRCLAPALAAG